MLSNQKHTNFKLLNQAILHQLSMISYYYYPDDYISGQRLSVQKPTIVRLDETSALPLFEAMERYEALKRLQMVLEIFTDVTQFPV